MSRETYVPKLFSLFQQYGYDGTTLSKISRATGLGKASLYHHFPGGKDDMVVSVLDYSTDWLSENVLKPLVSEGSVQERLQRMCDRISEFYDDGNQPCLLAILQASTGRDVFHSQVKTVLERWVEAIARVLIESGMNKALARQRGEDAIMSIQGALMLSQGIEDPSLFQRVIRDLPQTLQQTTSQHTSQA